MLHCTGSYKEALGRERKQGYFWLVRAPTLDYLSSHNACPSELPRAPAEEDLQQKLSWMVDASKQRHLMGGNHTTINSQNGGYCMRFGCWQLRLGLLQQNMPDMLRAIDQQDTRYVLNFQLHRPKTRPSI